MSLAPIILFVYNRLDHTQRTITALQSNALAKESELYIYADAAKNSQSIPQVDAVRNYLPSIDGFKKVNIHFREQNLGVDENVIRGVTEVINQHEKAIVLEDDLVTSQWFLTYMNEALDFYEQEKAVASIHGYVYPVNEKLKEVFFLKGADCWGWATWKRAWDLFEPDGMKLLDQLIKKGLKSEFDFNNTYPYFEALRDQATGNTLCWDIRWYASAFLQEQLTLYPGKSLVNNIGHDGSGTHCGDSNSHDVPLAQSPLNIKTDIAPDALAFDAFANFFTRLATEQAAPKKSWLSKSFRKTKQLIKKHL